MFPANLSSGENPVYSAHALENLAKWKGIFGAALRGVQRQVHPSLSAREDALEYIEKLMLQLLMLLCSSQPHTVQDVEDRVHKTFPDPIDKWAINDAQNALEKGKKNSTLLLPVDKVQPLLKEVLGYRVDSQVVVYIVAVIEYTAADILKFTGIYVKNIRHTEITSQDIKVAICADPVLVDMFNQEEDVTALMIEDEPVRRESMTYEEIVKDFIVEETQYLRDLNMIIKVFRAPFADLFPRSKDLDVIFSNILDIYEFTAKLLGSVEEQVEVAQDDELPLVGTCFEDLAEGEEFNVYERYVDDMLSPRGKERLNTLLQRDDVSKSLKNCGGNSFKDAVKYVLPKLLMGPVYHCLHYFEVIKALIDTSSCEEDQEVLAQANGLLQSLKVLLERRFSGNIPKRKPWEISLRLHGRSNRSQVQKMTELQRNIDGWEGKDIWQSCSEFILEGVLSKQAGRRWAERHVFLFDGLVILCKQNAKRTSGAGPFAEFKLKEKHLIRKMEIVDREDTDDVKNAFDIVPRDHPAITLCAKMPEEKCNWMAALITLQTRSMLERILDGKLREEEKCHPLIMPPPDRYRFAVKDSDECILFEEQQDSSVESPLIKGGTLIKLVERLTYHMYADPKFVRTFLLTYRSFCTPQELLDLLIERFDIVEPVMEPVGEDNFEMCLRIREDLKRFRKEYIKPVQFRVVNVLRHWVDHHFYDFERDKSLLEKLQEFLRSVKGKAMRKMADSIIKVIQRRLESINTEREFTHQKKPPQIEWHLTRNPEEFEIVKLHPVEIARQVTLLEFDLYRAIQPSELVGSPWTKEDKHKTSPNLLKMINFSTAFTFWLEKCILETENLEERVCVLSRIVEIMLVFQELNNFNGVLEVVGALISAPIYRLDHTFKEVPHKYVKALEEAHELNADHFKKYIEKLRSVNPPCVPFLGMYLTNILLTEEGNPNFIVSRPEDPTQRAEGFINFSKRRKVAEITGEIQQFQNQPYCLRVEPSIREFLKNLNPLEDLTVKELSDYMYAKSLELEPRNARQLPKFPKKYDFSLKSPGIKPSSHRHGPTSKSHTVPPNVSVPKTFEEEESSSPICTTPPTPSTPQTPPHTTSHNVFSDFGSSPGHNNATTICASIPEEDELRPKPPPLPPRRRQQKECVSSLDVCMRVTEPPPPPPRIDSSVPPPVPPRRDSMPITRHEQTNYNTIPRAMSMSQSRTSLGANTFLRHNSERNNSEPTSGLFASSSSSSVFDVNGDENLRERPVLPPRTYRSHSRKQSS
ncbi:son of sevenless homolog 2-like [Pomacea canaliculata]|uniref:son of sevenless homolog 2-like n=1 Tax=Pomacea canaliculata TaxID=400727 RepID=UPI000D73B0F3|nr:son of sevenless homolog 2-like [Pomacea canaliculata]